jgi:hypothetical protein
MTTTSTPNAPAPSAARSEPTSPLTDRPACASVIAPALQQLAHQAARTARPLTVLASAAAAGVETRAEQTIELGTVNPSS